MVIDRLWLPAGVREDGAVRHRLNLAVHSHQQHRCGLDACPQADDVHAATPRCRSVLTETPRLAAAAWAVMRRASDPSRSSAPRWRNRDGAVLSTPAVTTPASSLRWHSW